MPPDRLRLAFDLDKDTYKFFSETVPHNLRSRIANCVLTQAAHFMSSDFKLAAALLLAGEVTLASRTDSKTPLRDAIHRGSRVNLKDPPEQIDKQKAAPRGESKGKAKPLPRKKEPKELM